MTPFDQAWAFLKAPILTETINQVSDNRTEAQFQDPETKELHPMVAEKDPKYRGMNVGIYPESQLGTGLSHVAGLDAMDIDFKDIDDDIKQQLNLGHSNAHLSEVNDSPIHRYYESDMTWTDPEKRRRGYASALYDLVNQLDGPKVRPSGNQSDEGKLLWSKRRLPE